VQIGATGTDLLTGRTHEGQVTVGAQDAVVLRVGY
jgi:hypothetical protein